ncbi:MAG TPA: hypothetical protein ENK85_01540 [Saprospiraceae bacterium]|nr:hypothetical protein [Saprospiraceae bacterium]
MSKISSLFVTRLYRAQLSELGTAPDPEELERSCWSIAEGDGAGQQWSEDNGYPGYTSYASLNDLRYWFPIFVDLVELLDKHVAAFVEDLQFNLDGRKITLDSIWINILPKGGIHTSHLHPNSVISGTTYISVPKGAGSIKFEDPRHSRMMAAPTRKADAREEMQNFIYVEPKVGDVLLWESWLRHEVLMNQADEERISVSFNYGWE